MAKPRHWDRLQSEYVLKHPIVNMRRDTCRLADGRLIDDYYVLEENDVGMVFALTPRHELILVEQYKHGVGELCLELPAGLFDHQAADPLTEARREFVEETGFDAEHYVQIGTFIQNPSRMTSRVHLFLARDVYPVGEQRLDAHEDITVHQVPIKQVFDWVYSGRVSAAGTVAGIFRAWDYLQRHDNSGIAKNG